MNKKKVVLISISVIVLVILIVFFTGKSFGFFKYAKEGEVVNVITINGIKVDILNSDDDPLNLNGVYPVYDKEGMTNIPFEFTITNIYDKSFNYSLLVKNDEEKQADCKLENGDSCKKLNTDYIRYSYKIGNGQYSEPLTLGEVNDVIHTGIIDKDEVINFSIIIWIDSEAGNEIMNNYFFGKLIIQGNENESGYYQEIELNGADPILTDNLVPVIINNKGLVTKVNPEDEWYSYSKHEWANAVVLKNTDTYEAGQTIPESAIESYFVWIPKYSYQLWDLGNYNSLTTIQSKERIINVKFGLNDTNDSVTGECTTPGVAGESGNCDVGEYMTHPAFLAFDTNGLWVGKFETGFDGATSETTTEMNTYDSNKIIIKPNVYSWRNNTVGNMFKASLDYLRNDESHMMKNTEWGAVAYLQHSKYGSQISLRSNNNKAFITGYASTVEPTKGYNVNGTSIDGNLNESTELGVDGIYTINYFNLLSVVASTTDNYTGIYDMSGGAWDYVMGYTTESSIGVGGSSGITSLYSDFFTDLKYNKYYDKYLSTAVTNYDNRILGDATGEMGPFGGEKDPDNATRYKSSWYRDYAHFLQPNTTWFARGGGWYNGLSSGIFAFADITGKANLDISFRIVLAPTK